MKKKYAEKRISWKKITLALLGLITILALIFVVGLYLWMQTWSTYMFPDGRGTLRYPNNWVLKDEQIKVTDKETQFGTIHSPSSVLDEFGSNVPSLELVRLDITGQSIGLHEFALKTIYQTYDNWKDSPNANARFSQVNIGGNEGYVAGANYYRQYLFKNVNHAYFFHLNYVEKPANLESKIDNVLLSMIMSTLNFK